MSGGGNTSGGGKESTKGLRMDEKHQLERSNKKAKGEDMVEEIMDETMSEMPVMEGRAEGNKNTPVRTMVPYRDLFRGINGFHHSYYAPDEDVVLENDDLSEDEEDEDGEVSREKHVNPLCPGLDIRRERRIALCKPWRKSLIIKVMGLEVGYKFLLSRLQKIWNPQGEYEVIDMPNNYWTVRFTEDRDYQFALEGGPWMIAGHYLQCQRWKPEFKTNVDNVQKQAVWVRISGLPFEYYEKHTLWELGNFIGRTLRVDIHTIKENTGVNGLGAIQRGKFARICVEVNLNMTLVPKVRVRKTEYNVEYEGLSLICFGCGRYGHNQEVCPHVVHQQKDQRVSEGHSHGTRGAAEMPTGNMSVATEPPAEDFGSWMIAQRPQRRNRGNMFGKGFSSAESAKNKGKMIVAAPKAAGITEQRNQRGNKYDTLANMEEDADIYGGENDADRTVLNTDPMASNARGTPLVGHQVAKVGVTKPGETTAQARDQQAQGRRKRTDPLTHTGPTQSKIHGGKPNSSPKKKLDQAPRATSRVGPLNNISNVAGKTARHNVPKQSGGEIAGPSKAPSSQSLFPGRSDKWSEQDEIDQLKRIEEKRLMDLDPGSLDLPGATRVYTNNL